jgi:hypothetical protein
MFGAYNPIHVEVQVIEFDAIWVGHGHVEWDGDFSIFVCNLLVFFFCNGIDYNAKVEQKSPNFRDVCLLVLGYFLLNQRKRAGTPCMT